MSYPMYKIVWNVAFVRWQSFRADKLNTTENTAVSGILKNTHTQHIILNNVFKGNFQWSKTNYCFLNYFSFIHCAWMQHWRSMDYQFVSNSYFSATGNGSF